MWLWKGAAGMVGLYERPAAPGGGQRDRCEKEAKLDEREEPKSSGLLPVNVRCC